MEAVLSLPLGADHTDQAATGQLNDMGLMQVGVDKSTQLLHLADGFPVVSVIMRGQAEDGLRIICLLYTSRCV